MAEGDRHRLHVGRAGRQARRRRRGGLWRGRDLRERPHLLRRQPRGRAGPGGLARARDHRPAAVPRFRGPARAAARPRLRPCQAQVRADEPAGHQPAAGLQQRLARRDRRHGSGSPPTCTSWASWRRPTGSPSASRPCAGAGTSTTTARPGTRCARRPPRCRPDPRHLPRPGPQMPGRADRRRSRPSASSWCRPPTRPAIEMDLLFLSRHYRCFPGQGDLPVVVDDAEDRPDRLPGRVSHEIFSDDFRAGSPRQTATDGMRSFLLARGPAGRGPAGSPPQLRWHRVPGVRRRPQQRRRSAPCCRRWAFAAPIATAPRTSSCIARATSASSSTSRTRASPTRSSSCTASRWPPSPCASTTPRPRCAAPRRSWRKPFRGPIGQGELGIPAVRGVGGSLLYFLDRKLEPRAFVGGRLPSPTAEPVGGPDLGLRTIDHLAQVVPQTEFLSWILYYRAILGLEPEARTDLNDPRGLIVSRALTNPERTLRLPLNASQAQASAAGRFMERTAGAGAQHIAFACRRHLAAAAAARRAPTADPGELLRGPRSPLRPRRRLDSPARRSILYDRVGSGEFFHFFTRTSTACSSRCSSGAAATTAMARPMPQSGSPPRPFSTARWARRSPSCAGRSWALVGPQPRPRGPFSIRHVSKVIMNCAERAEHGPYRYVCTICYPTPVKIALPQACTPIEVSRKSN